MLNSFLCWLAVRRPDIVSTHEHEDGSLRFGDQDQTADQVVSEFEHSDLTLPNADDLKDFVAWLGRNRLVEEWTMPSGGYLYGKGLHSSGKIVNRYLEEKARRP